MKITYEWEESDIKGGIMYCRGTVNDTGYMLSTLAKIGFFATIPEDISSDLADLNTNKDGQKLMTSTAMTDGMTLIMTVDEMVEHLNSGDYRPVTKIEMALMVEKNYRDMRLVVK